MPPVSKKYLDQLPKALIAKAEKNKVRECDETEEGHYVAYVDDGAESYDVSLTLTADDAQGTCDCKNGTTFCRHQAALLIYISKEQKEKAVKKTKKKANPVDVLLQDADPDQLRQWLKGVLDKNKDIELSFVQAFAAPQEELNPQEVLKLIQDGIKAVARTKKIIDTSQVKKLVEVWQAVLESVIARYMADPTNEKSFLNLDMILQECFKFHIGSRTNSTKIPAYLRSILEQSDKVIISLAADGDWFTATKYFAERILGGVSIKIDYLIHIKNIADESTKARQARLIELLAGQLPDTGLERIGNAQAYYKVLLDLANANGLFAQYAKKFRPIQYANDYNHLLIGTLIEHDRLDAAETFCEQQVQANVREEYNLPYLELLKRIYTLQKNDYDLAKTLAVLFPYTFNFEDYLFVAARLTEEEENKWRTKMLAKARSEMRNKKDALTFYFTLLDHEKSYKKMVSSIDDNVPFTTIYQYFEPMAIADKKSLLTAMMSKANDYHWLPATDLRRADEQCFPQLYEAMLQYYPASHLQTVIDARRRDRWFSKLNALFIYIDKQLNEG